MTDNYKIPTLPLKKDIETKEVLKKLSSANRALGELKGISRTIPNENILISTLTLQEAKDSSEVENIITTHDEIFKAELYIDKLTSPAAKEVQDYANALRKGFSLVRKKKILSINDIISIQSELEQNNAGFRSLPGTGLKNTKTGEIIYTPPQNNDDIVRYMKNLEEFINKDEISNIDYLLKLAIIHHQFESIHPFYDGNGRTGRIINILYLVIKDLLELPVLYLSRYIIQNKSDYYKYLQEVRDTGVWENWIIYMLDGIENTSRETIQLIGEIKSLMATYKKKIRDELPKIYSQDLLNNLFKHPYTKIEFLESDIGVTRKTAAKYLGLLCDIGILKLVKIGRSNFYLNPPLFDIFTQSSSNRNIDANQDVIESKEIK